MRSELARMRLDIAKLNRSSNDIGGGDNVTSKDVQNRGNSEDGKGGKKIFPRCNASLA